jgi:hypothetical protein
VSKNHSFDTIINLMEEELKVLNNNGYRRYDNENLNHYISGYHYNQKEDKILVDWEEEA